MSRRKKSRLSGLMAARVIECNYYYPIEAQSKKMATQMSRGRQEDAQDWHPAKIVYLIRMGIINQ